MESETSGFKSEELCACSTSYSTSGNRLIHSADCPTKSSGIDVRLKESGIIARSTCTNGSQPKHSSRSMARKSGIIVSPYVAEDDGNPYKTGTAQWLRFTKGPPKYPPKGWVEQPDMVEAGRLGLEAKAARNQKEKDKKAGGEGKKNSTTARFANQEEMLNHVFETHMEQCHTCEVCAGKFDTVSDLVIHYLHYHPDKERSV